MCAKRRTALQVLMNGRLVGMLNNSARGLLTFTYSSSWLSFSGARSISLSLPLRKESHTGLVVENYFDNLLPDSLSIRGRLQARVGAESARCFDLLSQIGRDCLGALQLLPEGETVEVETVNAFPLSESEIATVLKNYQTMPLGISLEDDFRISLAGAQEKTAFLKYNGRWCRPAGATPTSHLFKIPIGNLGQSGIDLSKSVENEWLCLQILQAFGLPAAIAEIKTFDDQKVLVVERFDRRWAPDGKWLMRLPQEDLCQATGISSNLKYEADGGPGMRSIMDVLLGSLDSYNDRALFMKAQVIYWMLAAIDGHAKNFSIFHLPRGLYRLTPLYDVISAYPLVSAGQIDRQRLKMAMAVRGKNRHYQWDKFGYRHWLETAQKCHFSPIDMEKIIRECCEQTPDVVEEVGNQIGDGFDEQAGPIFEGLMAARERLCKLAVK